MPIDVVNRTGHVEMQHRQVQRFREIAGTEQDGGGDARKIEPRMRKPAAFIPLRYFSTL